VHYIKHQDSRLPRILTFIISTEVVLTSYKPSCTL
jgi:hypothetical protein